MSRVRPILWAPLGPAPAPDRSRLRSRRDWLRLAALWPALGLLLVAFLGGGCSSNPAVTKAGAGAWRVGLRDYRSGRNFELVNESHTSRVEQYSKLRDNADRKVQSDEIVAELVGWLESEGFGKLAQAGTAPSEAGGDRVWVLEVQGPTGPRHVLVTKSVSQDDYAICRKLKAGFLDIYNATYAGQAKEMQEGETPFLAPEPPKRLR